MNIVMNLLVLKEKGNFVGDTLLGFCPLNKLRKKVLIVSLSLLVWSSRHSRS
jgi:hypothetical protein